MNEQETARDTENGKDPAELERDIDRTRASLGRTVDALERRLSPGELLDQALGMAREQGGQFAANLGRSVRNNPMPVILTGVGLAWMMASSNEPRAPLGYEDWSAANGRDTKGGLKSGVSSVKSAVGAASERASRATDSVAHSIGSLGESLGESASDVGERVRMQSEQIRYGFDRLMQEQPLIVGAIGLAIGAALGAALPRTESEDQLLGRASDSVMDSVRDRAAEAYDEVKDTAADVVASARDSERTGGKGEEAREQTLRGTSGNEDRDSGWRASPEV